MMRTDQLTPTQHGFGMAALYAGLLVGCMATIHALSVESNQLYKACKVSNSADYCAVKVWGR